MISQNYFGNCDNNKPYGGESTFAIRPVGSSQPKHASDPKADFTNRC